MASEKNVSKSLIMTVIVAVIVGAAAFFGGMTYQKSQVVTSNGQFAGMMGRNGENSTNGGTRMGRGFGGGAVVGQIVSLDKNSITVQLTDGSSKIVNLSVNTTYSKSSTGALSDLADGTKVAVFGTPNSDGSVTAQNVQINPIARQRAEAPTAKPLNSGK